MPNQHISTDRMVTVSEAAAVYNSAFLTTFLHRHMYLIAGVGSVAFVVGLTWYLS